MPSLPLTPNEEKIALKTIGVSSIDDLFQTVPPQIREKARITLDYGPGYEGRTAGFTEHELRNYFSALAEKNTYAPKTKHFLGGGIYDNVIPAIVTQLVQRGEFLTCYTPYQPEISQGTLQAIFEFQTMMCRITGMPIANASMYDGPTATAEAALMAQRLGGKDHAKVWIAGSLNPDYRAVVKTFLSGHSDVPSEIGWKGDGTLDLDQLAERLKTEKPACLVVGYPNYFGIMEPLADIKRALPKETMLVVSVQDPSALSIFETPGALGADIVAGEGHQLGTPMLFGGPHVGFFASKKEYLRQMPGRLCGETVDVNGKRSYTLTLSTREQHIRREKATSNICTNQGLIALRTVIYLSFLGKAGFLQLGEGNFSRFQYVSEALAKKGVSLRFKSGNHYREGVFDVPHLKTKFEKALKHDLIPGIRLGEKWGADFENSLLVSVNPKHTKKDLDILVEALA